MASYTVTTEGNSLVAEQDGEKGIRQLSGVLGKSERSRSDARCLWRGEVMTRATNDPGIRKQYLKSRNACKVTFRLSRIAAPQADRVCIAGEFNNRNTQVNPMKKLKNGDFRITLELEPGKEYQFRYLIDDAVWENEWNADAYVVSPFGHCDNSVVLV